MANIPHAQPATPNQHPQQELIARCHSTKATLLQSLLNPVTSTQCIMEKQDVEEVIGMIGQVNDLLTKAVFNSHPDHPADLVPASAQFWHNAGYKADTPDQQAFCYKEAYNHLVNHLYSL